jgi:hypothetical protein
MQGVLLPLLKTGPAAMEVKGGHDPAMGNQVGHQCKSMVIPQAMSNHMSSSRNIMEPWNANSQMMCNLIYEHSFKGFTNVQVC